jgi:serine/threonine-protein kinase
LLNIPKNAKTLESSLGVNIYENFVRGQLARAAFQKSGVSQQNRMLERHDTRTGGRYYVKSYDMLPGSGEKGDFSRRPLGPKFEESTGRPLAAFEHDGGEIIWSLPNGLQGYMLVDGKDQRIASGPPEVVFDPNGHGGSFLITNGISCMGCHKHGMINFTDEIRPLYERKSGQKVADKVLELYPPSDQMKELVQGDRDHFLRSLQRAIGPFLQVENDKHTAIEKFAEPTTKVSNRYLRDVSLETAARELGLAEPAELKGMLRLKLFRDLGLGNWSNETGTVSRETWERAYGRCARELQLGIPIRFR